MSNFLITAMGRSGTKWLSTMMNYSKKWKVKHEPDRSWLPHDSLLEDIQERFDKETKKHKRYGEVNSTLRYMASKLRVNKKGVIIRNPVDVWISLAHRRPTQVWPSVLWEYERTIKEFSMLKAMGLKFIDFEKMIKDRKYLEAILDYFGIEDSRIKDKAFDMPLNVTEVRIYDSLDDFDKEIQDRVKNLRDRAMRLLY